MASPTDFAALPTGDTFLRDYLPVAPTPDTRLLLQLSNFLCPLYPSKTTRTMPLGTLQDKC